jgi:hypothetical protein
MSTEQLSPLISNGTAWRVPATAACPQSARNTAAGADRRRERGQLACVRCAKRARVVRAYASACARPRGRGLPQLLRHRVRRPGSRRAWRGSDLDALCHARVSIVSREAFGRLTCARQGCKLTLCVRFKPTTVTMKGRTGRPPACQAAGVDGQVCFAQRSADGRCRVNRSSQRTEGRGMCRYGVPCATSEATQLVADLGSARTTHSLRAGFGWADTNELNVP